MTRSCEETCVRSDCSLRGCLGGYDSEIDESRGEREVLNEARKMIVEYELRVDQVRGQVRRSTFWPDQQEWAAEASRLTERIAALRELIARFE